MSFNTNLEGYNVARNMWLHFYNPNQGTFIAPKKCSGTYNNERFNVWSVAIGVQAIIDGARIYPNEMGPLIEPAINTFRKYKNNTMKGYSAAEGGDGDVYYDDDAQVCSCFLSAFEVTGNRKYLDQGRELTRFLMGGWNNDPNAATKGGMKWHVTKNYLNACTTAEVAKCCLQIAKYIPNEAKTYIDFAAKCIDWQIRVLRDKDGFIVDGLGLNSTKPDDAKWTYNVGTTLSAASFLYEFTKDNKWKDIAYDLARVAIDRNSPFYDRDYPNDKRYWRDASYFNQLLFEGLADFMLVFGDQLEQSHGQKIYDEIARHLKMFHTYSKDDKDGLYLQSFEPHRGTEQAYEKYKKEFGGKKHFEPRGEDKNGDEFVKCLIGCGAAARCFFQGARVAPSI